MFRYKLLALCTNILALAFADIKKEYCVGKLFNPSCDEDEIILMRSALYGQMAIGTCVKMDVGGYLGCQSDVLAQFDRECSGRTSCEILVTDVHIESNRGCPDEISKYLLANYTCVKRGMAQFPECEANSDLKIVLKSQHSYITNRELNALCDTYHAPLILTAENGQRLNVSVIKLSQSPHAGTFGSIVDPITNERAVIGSEQRTQHLISSSRNELKLSLPTGSNNDNFILQIEVYGCPNLTPPNGAWMTRDNDVLEIGCHSGDKTWTMHCQNNQWVGAVGQCGIQTPLSHVPNYDREDVENTGRNELFPDDLSLSSIIFAACSVMIFISSLIFMIGVCTLRSQRKNANQLYYNNSTLVECMLPAYKSDGFQTIQT